MTSNDATMLRLENDEGEQLVLWFSHREGLCLDVLSEGGDYSRYTLSPEQVGQLVEALKRSI